MVVDKTQRWDLVNIGWPIPKDYWPAPEPKESPTKYRIEVPIYGPRFFSDDSYKGRIVNFWV